MGRILKRATAEPSASKLRREKHNLVQMVVEIPYELDVRLEAMAAFRKMRRSDLVKLYCDQSLRKTDFDKIVRSGLPESELNTGEEAETLPLKIEGSGEVEGPTKAPAPRGRAGVRNG